MIKNSFIILDFGSQLTQLIARRIRELGCYAEIFPYDISEDKIRSFKPAGIILSGGPNSVVEKGSLIRDIEKLRQIAPLCGICYGMQLISYFYGAVVKKVAKREYGFNNITWNKKIINIPKKQKVWMSHGDVVENLPEKLKVHAKSQEGYPAVISGEKLLAFQFHPEVSHTEHGKELLDYYVKYFCKAKSNWKTSNIINFLEKKIKDNVDNLHNKKKEKVLIALSGGVDSSIVASLLTKVLGKSRVKSVFINNGLLRKNEYENVLQKYQQIGLNVEGLNGEKKFLDRLKGIIDPEKKRKIIGNVFIEIFEDYIKTQKNDKKDISYLAQGTLYPDVIESISPRGSSVTIKSHHNVGGLPKKMNLKLVEPLRELFKDEVRVIGKKLGLPKEILWRHPFPGPGLAVRIIGEVTLEKLKILRECDHIFISSLKEFKLYDKIWQAFCVLLPIYTVGVQGDARTYERVIALRAITSLDGMTADWYPFESSFLQLISNRITNNVKEVNRVVYDITSKPPATIEWE